MRAYGGNIDADDAAPAVTDANGLARIVLEVDDKHLQRKAIKDLLKFGYSEMDLRVEHPEHPTKIAYFDPIGAGSVTLVDPETVEIRRTAQAKKSRCTAFIQCSRHPRSIGRRPPMAWSRFNGSTCEVKYRRVSCALSRSPMTGVPGSATCTICYCITRPIAIDAELKPGVHVEGRLADDVPRPIKNGRVVARIVEAQTGWVNDSHWDAVADIAADGTFVFESLPPDADLQVTAICDGWVSKNPADDVITERRKQVYGDGLDPRRFKMGIVFPQVFRLEGDPIKATIPMVRTAIYEVTVLDENDRPLPGAESATGRMFYSTVPATICLDWGLIDSQESGLNWAWARTKSQLSTRNLPASVASLFQNTSATLMPMELPSSQTYHAAATKAPPADKTCRFGSNAMATR